MSDREEGAAGYAEQVYAAPADALSTAQIILKSDSVTSAERADALLVVGRSAYYANQMTDAVRLLQEAVPLAEEPATLTEILLTLAPALSKEGKPDEALLMLDDPALELEAGHAGQLRNQRGIILTELGRLPEAMSQMEEALALLRDAGDHNRETRTMVNLGAVASMMGHLDEAERWYDQARDKTVVTGQKVVAAGIEGNLGDLESRRGRFAPALRWYESARVSFEQLGDVDLLVAVLELDHARTLLDVGLAVEAVDATERAARSAAAGHNQMLETQARVMLAESLLKLGELNGAARALRRGVELANRLGQAPWVLRAAYLASEIGLDTEDVLADGVEQFLAAGWVREAYEFALNRAFQLRRVDPEAAKDLMTDVEALTTGLHVDPVNRALGALVRAEIEADAEAGDQALDAALEALGQQRDLLGSVEIRAVLTHRARPIRDAAVSLALGSDDPAPVVLGVLERIRVARRPRSGPDREAGVDSDQLGQLRAARVALDQVKLEGGNVAEAAATVQRLERRILGRRRSQTAERTSGPGAAAATDVELPADTAYVTFVVHDQRILGIARFGPSTTLVDVAPVAAARPLIRVQRRALRRLADERTGQVDRHLAALAEASADLSRMLIEVLPVADAERFVVTPPTSLHDVVWGALPSLRNRSVTLAPGLTEWDAERQQPRVGQIGLLEGPGLARAGDELDAIAALWRLGERAGGIATCGHAMTLLATADLVHIAAHGAFRADNPFFSSLWFADGPLSILELSELEQLPTVVVLASCDAATGAAVGSDEGVVVGTATELRHLGARIVIAPSVVVNDRAAVDVSLKLHSSLAAGGSVDEAMLQARTSVLSSDDPRCFAAAAAFQVFGGRSTRTPMMLATAQ